MSDKNEHLFGFAFFSSRLGIMVLRFFQVISFADNYNTELGGK